MSAGSKAAGIVELTEELDYRTLLEITPDGILGRQVYLLKEFR